MITQIKINPTHTYPIQGCHHDNPLLKQQHPQMSPHAFNQQNIVIEDPRVVKRIVNNLMYLFNITTGDYLTFILGQGHCTRNEDALKYWVMEQLEHHNLDSDNVLQYLVEKLKIQLNMEVFS
ncbi:MAG: hypothetical protein CO158_04795 [Piscirickettsiaceae bacterium CG_4_9_14_3_um_filter_43_564]|nr:hypothetical protein [Thiomicrospira sp.]NCN67370.1 hypothetical protein [Thiomicrospira sp.]NCO13610.1 hypothetical protein [Thiomicrospira sp.]PJA66169.1 MAG: hypothetical protein CO158_04795 [Piscirickettsiaceae bacterium CG_4_9_14_3_um_filter_43_564]